MRCVARVFLAATATATACTSFPSVTTTEGNRVIATDSGPDGLGSGGTGTGFELDASPDAEQNRDAPCGATDLGATVRPVQILLVVDASTSMNQTPDGYSQNKWAAMASALSMVLSETKQQLSYGLELFPQGGACQMPALEADAIVVPVAAGTDSAAPILAALPDRKEDLLAGTPTAAALDAARTYFTVGAGQALPGDKVVLLATDGGPNCNGDPVFTCGPERCTLNLDGQICGTPGTNCCVGGLSCLDDQRSANAAAALLQAKIKTYVVGIPGSDVYATTLNALAIAGGTNSYFRVDPSGDTSGLANVLLGITKSLINSCRLELTSTPPKPDLLNVEIDGKLVLKGPDGWEIDASSVPMAIVLQGATCTKITNEGAEAVKIVYGCPTVE